MPKRDFYKKKLKREKTDFRSHVFQEDDIHSTDPELTKKIREEAYEAGIKEDIAETYEKYLQAGGDEAFLPDDMADMDAVLGCTIAMLGSIYNIKDDDISGLHSVCLWYAWAYHECKKRGYDWVRELHGGTMAYAKGLDRKTIKKMREMYKDTIKTARPKDYEKLYGKDDD